MSSLSISISASWHLTLSCTRLFRRLDCCRLLLLNRLKSWLPENIFPYQCEGKDSLRHLNHPHLDSSHYHSSVSACPIFTVCLLPYWSWCTSALTSVSLDISGFWDTWLFHWLLLEIRT